MTAIRIIASIVLGLGATTSAFAAEPTAAPTPMPTPVAVTAAASALPSTITLAAGSAAVAAARKASPNARYCFRTEVTGSLIRTKMCKTRSEWEARGVDLDRALAGL